MKENKGGGVIVGRAAEGHALCEWKRASLGGFVDFARLSEEAGLNPTTSASLAPANSHPFENKGLIQRTSRFWAKILRTCYGHADPTEKLPHAALRSRAASEPRSGAFFARFAGLGGEITEGKRARAAR